jgi:photosystem II stability/assembly factor-like uncharacterized protein
MKKLFVTILSYSLFLNANLSAQWKILNEGFNGSLNSIDFVNDNLGWIAGSNGTLFKTTDGGENWITISINENWQISQIDFTNESVGFAIGSDWDSSGTYSIIIKSIDGGDNWQMQKRIFEISLNQIYIIDENNVYAVGIKIYKTSDGGVNWIDVSPNLTGRSYNSVWFKDIKSGVVVGNYYNNIFSSGIILRTTNGGSTWNENIVSQFGNIYDLQFSDSTNGYFRAQKDTIHFLCKSEDMCSTWTVKIQNRYWISSYQVLDSKTTYAIMPDSTTANIIIMKSSDGGTNWQYIEAHNIDWCGINKIFFTKVSNALLLGSTFGGSVLFRSTDEGYNWIIKKFNYPLTDACFINQDIGILVGGGCFGGGRGHSGGCWPEGKIFMTNDGGKTWNYKYGTGDIFRSAVFINNSIAFSLASGTNIYKTTDTGNNWKMVYVSNPDSMGYSFQGNEICFKDAVNGFVSGYYSDSLSGGAGILSTTNGGLSWELGWKFPNTAVYQYNFNSINFADTGGWAVGESGLIVKYSNQNDWVRKDSVTDLPLNKVFCLGDNVWITGGYSNEQNRVTILLRSTNGGEEWTKISNIPYLIYDIDFIDQNVGWAIGYDGSGVGGILKTTNGGNSWEVDTGNLSSKLNSLFIKDNYGWAVGDNGLILRTTNAGPTWVNDDYKTLPTEFVLEQNYPNPFNPSTKIKYSIPTTPASLPLLNKEGIEGWSFTLKVYDVLGKEVATLVDEYRPAGTYEIEFNSKTLSSGIYFYRLSATGGDGYFIQTKKMVIIK